jgi:hypothetical protein
MQAQPAESIKMQTHSYFLRQVAKAQQLTQMTRKFEISQRENVARVGVAYAKTFRARRHVRLTVACDVWFATAICFADNRVVRTVARHFRGMQVPSFEEWGRSCSCNLMKGAQHYPCVIIFALLRFTSGDDKWVSKRRETHICDVSKCFPDSFPKWCEYRSDVRISGKL